MKNINWGIIGLGNIASIVAESFKSINISEISNQLLKSQTKPHNPAISIDEILLNTSIMNNWIDYKV